MEIPTDKPLGSFSWADRSFPGSRMRDSSSDCRTVLGKAQMRGKGEGERRGRKELKYSRKKQGRKCEVTVLKSFPFSVDSCTVKKGFSAWNSTPTTFLTEIAFSSQPTQQNYVHVTNWSHQQPSGMISYGIAYPRQRYLLHWHPSGKKLFQQTHAYPATSTSVLKSNYTVSIVFLLSWRLAAAAPWSV